jgi:phosphoglycolate phosphatase
LSGALAGPVELVVFDLDGTLVDSSRDLADSVNAALARLAPLAPPLALETVRAFVGSGAALLIGRSLAAAGVPRPVEELLPLFLEEYSRRLLAHTRLYPGVREALDGLAGRRLAVLTNKPGEMSRAILAGLGVADRFLRILGADDVPARKPDPAGLLGLLSETGTPAGRALIVGDSELDVLTGRNAGVRCVGVRYGFDPAGLERAAPDVLLGDLRELPRLLGAGSASVLP